MARVQISKISIDPEIAKVGRCDRAIIDDWSQQYEAGSIFPDVRLVRDGANLWLCDGFTRLAAAKKAGREDIEADVTEGTLEDARLIAAGANHTNGQIRTAKDKTHAVLLLLNNGWWSQTDRWIAEKCHVSPTFVGHVRSSHGKNGQTAPRVHVDTSETRVGRDGKTYPAEKREDIYCERCTRVGPVKDCKVCKIAREHARHGREPGDDRLEEAQRRQTKGKPKQGEVFSLKELEEHIGRSLAFLDKTARFYGLVGTARRKGDMAPLVDTPERLGLRRKLNEVWEEYQVWEKQLRKQAKTKGKAS
jgi:hypothetical protein